MSSNVDIKRRIDEMIEKEGTSSCEEETDKELSVRGIIFRDWPINVTYYLKKNHLN